MSFMIKDLWCHYGGAEILKGISLEMEEGNTITIIGSNGAGKSTILRSISGFKKITSGEIWFQGERIDNKLPQEIVKRGIIHVLEGRALFPHMTVLENLKLGAFLRKDKNKISEDLEEVFQHFPRLKERRHQSAKTLSGGEQQMLAIGRALMSAPKLLLMDEPSLGLSPIMTTEIGRIVYDIRKRGISVILVEQNARLALNVSKYAYVLETGEFVLQGEASELRQSDSVRKAYIE